MRTFAFFVSSLCPYRNVLLPNTKKKNQNRILTLKPESNEGTLTAVRFPMRTSLLSNPHFPKVAVTEPQFVYLLYTKWPSPVHFYTYIRIYVHYSKSMTILLGHSVYRKGHGFQLGKLWYRLSTFFYVSEDPEHGYIFFSKHLYVLYDYIMIVINCIILIFTCTKLLASCTLRGQTHSQERTGNIFTHFFTYVPSRIQAVPARPVPGFGCPGPSRPLARF